MWSTYFQQSAEDQMKVNFYATLRSVVGAKAVEFPLADGSTVRDLLKEMIRCYPNLGPELLNEQDQLYQHVHIFMNGRDVMHLEQGLETPLAADEVLGVFPAVGGG
jgi:sulfur-carrier protein